MTTTPPQRRISRVRDLASYLAFNGSCVGHQSRWAAAEHDHEASTTRWAARVAAAPALELCTACPVAAECGEWAKLDRYNGLAAGQAWINGRPRPADWPKCFRYRQTATSTPMAS